MGLLNMLSGGKLEKWKSDRYLKKRKKKFLEGEMDWQCTFHWGIPKNYYNYMAVKKRKNLEQAATFLQEIDPDCKNYSRPQLLCCAIYFAYHEDCKRYKAGDFATINFMKRRGISPKEIDKGLEWDPKYRIMYYGFDV